MKEILKLKNASVKFKETLALNDLSFSVYDNEIFGFLGPSGAGKTTAIKVLTKQLKLNNGSAYLFNQSLESLGNSVYDTLGIMTDSNDIYEGLSVLENLNLFADLRNVDRNQVELLLRQVGLWEDRSKLAKKLSKGMRQRLILSTALIHKPKILFLDEPTAALDPKTTLEIHTILRNLNQEGTTIFLTTHSMDEAEKLCDRIAFLDQGEIMEIGSKDELKLKYAQNKINVVYASGTRKLYEKSNDGLAQILNDGKDDDILTIHSVEPSLEDIFLDVTGRSDYELA
ncbi:ABC transporter ATP-binding protein [Erysipelothrix urinaevulpis]|uniref:ABC transporter ATP-binding protein n=1 Tax=Erysipelothrix urinaevulpis TaxID=2683717 RepID=UPI00135BAB13|nr:ABC transporter ATP-binding protein [Erysipelothrix urinaevulpis]